MVDQFITDLATNSDARARPCQDQAQSDLDWWNCPAELSQIADPQTFGLKKVVIVLSL